MARCSICGKRCYDDKDRERLITNCEFSEADNICEQFNDLDWSLRNRGSKKIISFIGLPASGKSTWFWQFLDAFQKGKNHTIFERLGLSFERFNNQATDIQRVLKRLSRRISEDEYEPTTDEKYMPYNFLFHKKSENKRVKITFFDHMGEDFNEEYVNIYNERVANSDAFIFLIDSEKQFAQDNESLINHKLSNQNIIKTISEIYKNNGETFLNKPTVICFSKFDLLQGMFPFPVSPWFDDEHKVIINDRLNIQEIHTFSNYIKDFLKERNMEVLIDSASNDLAYNKDGNLKEAMFFAVSPRGYRDNNIPLADTEPFGINAPIVWLLHELNVI